MDVRILTFRAFAAALSVSFGVILPLTGHGGGAYLPRTGPVPLRFAEPTPEIPVAINLPPLPPSAPETPEVEVPVATVEPTPDATSTNAAPLTIVSTNFPGPVTVAEKAPAPGPYTFRPAEELPVVSRDMLIEYLQPAPAGTNRAGVTVVLPVETGFAPPRPSQSSSAVYRSQ